MMLTLTEREMEAINEVREQLNTVTRTTGDISAELHIALATLKRLRRDMENIWTSIAERNSLRPSSTPTPSDSESPGG